MAPASFEQYRHAGIDDAIQGLKSIAPLTNHADLSKALQLIRDGLDPHPCYVCEVTHTEFIDPNQGVEQTESGRMGQALEEDADPLGFESPDERASDQRQFRAARLHVRLLQIKFE